MAKATRQLSNEELRGFVNELGRIKQFQGYQQNVRANQAAGANAAGIARDNGPRGPVGGSGGIASGGGAGGGGASFDPIRAGERTLDILGALGYANQAVYSGSMDQAERGRQKAADGDIIGGLLEGAAAGARTTLGALNPEWWKGLGDALSGNQDDLVMGYQNVEKLTDLAGRNDPNYKDVKDNVNPIAKGVAGFALDVAGDPLTALPAGPIARGVEGGFKASVDAARAAKGGDLAKTAAFFNPVKAAPGFVSGVKSWASDAKNALPGFGAKASDEVADEAVQRLSTAPRVAANVPARKAVEPAVAATATEASQKVAQGVAEGARAAEAAAAAAARQGAGDAPVVIEDTAGQLTLQDIGGKRMPAARTEGQATVDAVTDQSERQVRTQIAEQLAPDIARAADAGSNTPAVLAALRGLTYQTNRFPGTVQRAMRDVQPIQSVPKAERKAWMDRITGLVGADNASQLAKIADPVALRQAADKMVGEVTLNAMKAKTPTQLFQALGSRRNAFDPAAVREITSMLGLSGLPKKGEWREFQDALRKVDPKAAYDEMVRREALNTDLLSATNLPGRGVATKLADDIDPDGARAAAGNAADDLLDPEIAREYDEAIAGIFPEDFSKTHPFVGTSKDGERWHRRVEGDAYDVDAKPVARNVFNQQHQLTLWKKIFDIGQERFKRGSQRARQDALYEYVKDGLKYTDLRLRSLGIAPVNGALGAEKNLLRSRGDYAFLSFGDILDALPPDTAKALLFSGRDLNVNITFLSDLARDALRLSETGLDSVAQTTELLHRAQARLTKEAGSAAKRDTEKWLRNPKNADVLRGIGGAFADPEVIQRLAEANARNLAFALAVNGKKAWRAAKPIIETLRQFTADPNVSVGKQIDATLEAKDALRSMVRATGIEDTPADGLAESLLDRGLTQATSSAALKQARAALDQERAVVDASGQQITKGAREARTKKAEEAVAAANAPGVEGKAPGGGAKTPTGKKATKKSREAANSARMRDHAAHLDDVNKLVDDVIRQGDAVLDDPVMDVDAARAAFSMDLPGWLRLAFKGAEKMDGWFGKERVKGFAISAEMSSQNMQYHYTRALNDVSKAHAPGAIRGAVSIFRGMDGNEGLEAALLGAPEEVAAAARQLWPTFAMVFDHSNHSALQRVGLDGSYLNSYLRRQGVPNQYLLAGEQSWENGTAWRYWNWDNIDPIVLIDNYHRAIVKAQVVPDVAANFSAQFGNRSTVYGPAMSPEEARAAGWVKADSESGRFGGLFTFLDKDQYYPKEMLTQLALMDDYFAASRSLDENTLFDKFFRYADPVQNSLKASITLWRPGHHITNILGEFLMNTLAGVVNPLRYRDAARVLGNMGKIDGQAMTSLERYLQAAAPEGVQLKSAARGTPVMIGGREIVIDDQDLYRLLDQSGAIIHHNNAEDLLNETFDVVGRSTSDAPKPTSVQQKLHKVNKLAAPGWLGKFSANRDNLFRIAHAIDILQKNNFSSIESAMARLTKEINSFHPNMHTLGAAEQKYVRRLVYFYTWQRQAITRVMMSMIDTPGRITIAPKALFNVGIANGVEGESWGQPVPEGTFGIPDYLQGNVGQFMYYAGLGGGQPETDTDNYLWGASINAPQLDIIQSVLGSVAVDPDKPAWEQAGDTAWQLTSKNVLQNLPPVFKIPAELGTHSQFGTGTRIQEGEEGQYLLNQTGLRAPLLFTGIAGVDENDDPAIQQQKRDNALFNWLTGTKRTIYDGPEQQEIAWRQELERLREASER